MIGYAKDNSHTQVFNCHKLLEYKVGLPMDLTNFGHVHEHDQSYALGSNSVYTVLKAYLDQETYKVDKSIRFYQELLKDQASS